MATASSTDIPAVVRREVHRLTRAPDSGIAMTEPAAIESSTRPSSDALSPRWVRTCGMREAQLAKAKPAPMNATDVARAAVRTRASATPLDVPTLMPLRRRNGRRYGGTAAPVDYAVRVPRPDPTVSRRRRARRPP